MVYKWDLGYFSYFCSPTTYERAFRIHKKKRHNAVKRHIKPLTVRCGASLC